MAKRFVVVGAGIIGASIAYHLGREAEKRQDAIEITIIDQAPTAASGATSASWAWLNASYKNPKHYFDLRCLSMLEYRRLQAELSNAFTIDWCGSINFEITGEKLQNFTREHANWGYDIQLLGRQAIQKLEPNLINPPELAAHSPCEGALDPVALTNQLIAACKERFGAKVLFDTSLRGFKFTQDRITALETDQGPVEADQVILASGIANSGFCEQLGIHLPHAPKPGLMTFFETPKRLINSIIVNRDLMIRQLNAHVLITEMSPSLDHQGHNPTDLPAQLAKMIAEQFHSGDQIRHIESRAADRPIPKDGMPVIGRLPSISGLYLALTHSGVTLAPIVGRFAASEMLQGIEIDMLAPFRIQRFQA